MVVKCYVYGSRESLTGVGLRAGLKGDALRMFEHACDEFQMELEVDPSTGLAAPISIDGKPIGKPDAVLDKTEYKVQAGIGAFEDMPFVMQWNIIAAFVNEIAVSKGWWKGDRNDGELIALMHSELSEALEGMRHGNPSSEHLPEFTAVEEELADVVIRIMDFARAKHHRVGEAIIAKVEYNRTREFMHGGKKF
jgi:NTP pyrophosphatase (non-canonical NTP hydrolase)